MENKKLVKILLKDMTELEELISEVKIKGNFETMEMEFLHTRAKGVLQLLQLLDVEIEHDKIISRAAEKKIEIEQTEEVDKKSIILPENLEEANAEKVMDENKASIQEKKEVQEEKIETSKEVNEEVVAEKQENEVKEEAIFENKGNDEEVKVEKEELDKSEESDVELEEEEQLEANQRLGDSFLKGKSVNDIINEPNNLEFKLSNRPVTSIKSAIGINDRFQYIRELFEGDAEMFSKTVSDIDAMDNIKDAVVYLQKNFKWKKNDTSLKFVSLVKRRFSHD